MTRAIRSEFIKIRTVNTWWLMTLGLLIFTALALLVNAMEAHFDLQHQTWFEDSKMPEEERASLAAEEAKRYAEAHSAAGIAKITANLLTSGQFFGALLMLLLAAIVVTNEFFHQTATATFLATPHRTVVILAKFAVASVLGLGAWLLTSAINVGVTFAFLNSEHVTIDLLHQDVIRSVLLNLAAYAVWAVLGVSLGVLIRSQIGAVVTGTVVYLLGLVFSQIVFQLIHSYLIKEDWVLGAQVVVPAVASMVMITPGKLYAEAPEQWVGAAVLIGYALVFGLIGTLITRRRDIS